MKPVFLFWESLQANRTLGQAQHPGDDAQLWQAFLEEAQPTLQSDFDYALKDAIALLRRECNVK